MRKICVLALLSIAMGLYGCAGKKAPDFSPVQSFITGEYDFAAVGLGAGHGFMFLPGILPNSKLIGKDLIYVVPTGKFTFNTDGTFRLSLGLGVKDGSPKDIREEYFKFNEVDGTYKVTSKNMITLTTKYSSSEYLYVLNHIYPNQPGAVIELRLIPSHTWYPMQISGSESDGGKAILDLIYLTRKANKAE